jgi:hypothetical protein
MPYRIQKTDGFVEIYLWGETSPGEVLVVLRRLHDLAPSKELSDLWIFSSECVIPCEAYQTIVKAAQSLCCTGMIASRSAIVAADQFQKAQLELYLREAQNLPFEIGAFTERDEAVEWLKRKSEPHRPPRRAPARAVAG